MADDAIFDEGDSGEGTLEGEEGEGGAAAAAASAAPDMSEAMKAAVGSTFGGLFQDLAATLNDVNNRLSSIESKASEAGGAGADIGDLDLNKLLGINDGASDADIDKKMSAMLESKAGPLLQTLLTDKYETLESQFSEQIDREFGKGAWEESFQDNVRSVMTNLPAKFQASKKHFESTVNGVKGSLFSHLSERATKVKAEATDSSTPPSGHYVPVGEGRARPPSGQLSGEEKDMLAIWARNGINYTAKDYIRDRDAGSDVDSFPIPKVAKAKEA